MMSLTRCKQKGATLLVGMIMLVVLTLLVVASIRSGIFNLRIAGNMQTQTEAAAATQQVLEQVINEINVPLQDVAQIKAQTVTVSVGNANYAVNVEAMKNNCIFEKSVLNSELDSSVENDIPCFESPDEDKGLTSTGTLTTKPSACSTQQWDIVASVDDPVSGAKVTEVQGITIRVPATTTCL